MTTLNELLWGKNHTETKKEEPKKSAPIKTASAKQVHAEFKNASTAFICEVEELERHPKFERSISLNELGFTSHPDSELTKGHKEKKALIVTIKTLSQKYPLYKFITEIQVRQILDKYDLVLGELSSYKGELPDKNLEEIKNFKIDNEDKGVEYSRFSGTQSHAALKIIAPLKDMNLRANERVVNKIIVASDPIVLQPVNGGYLIVSAWGDEASDELVINPIQN